MPSCCSRGRVPQYYPRKWILSRVVGPSASQSPTTAVVLSVVDTQPWGGAHAVTEITHSSRPYVVSGSTSERKEGAAKRSWASCRRRQTGESRLWALTVAVSSRPRSQPRVVVSWPGSRLPKPAVNVKVPDGPPTAFGGVEPGGHAIAPVHERADEGSWRCAKPWPIRRAPRGPRLGPTFSPSLRALLAACVSAPSRLTVVRRWVGEACDVRRCGHVLCGRIGVG